MNFRAERIEQTIQVINRNLLLIYSGQKDDITPLDIRQLQKVDAGIFGNDKFAFEMVYYVNSFKSVARHDSSLSSIWEKNFVRGLETLLVESALAKDDIERDCFVSRIYCWFTEKIAEKRDLPRIQSSKSMDNLKSSIRSLDINSDHTMKGLNEMERTPVVDNASLGKEMLLNDGNSHADDISKDLALAKNRFTKEKVSKDREEPYMKLTLPNVFKPRPDYNAMLPSIPNIDENFGMVYNKPESEAEKVMNELWVAKRRQEAFEWKTRQHMSLVMDRLALQKSRMEFDALRRQESNNMMSNPRPSSEPTSSRLHSPNGRRPTSGSRYATGHALSTAPPSLKMFEDEYSSRDSSPAKTLLATMDNGEDESMDEKQPFAISEYSLPTSIIVEDEGEEKQIDIQRPSRSIVTKIRRDVNVNGPMRFRSSGPTPSSVKTLERNEYYMQLSDSDDDDKPDRMIKSSSGTHVRAHSSKGNSGGGAANSKVVKPAAPFKHDKPVIRERPQSAKAFRRVAIEDPELKVKDISML